MKIKVLSCIKNSKNLFPQTLQQAGAGRGAQGYLTEQESACLGFSRENKFRVRWRWERRGFKIVSGSTQHRHRTYQSFQLAEHNESYIIKSYLSYNGNFH